MKERDPFSDEQARELDVATLAIWDGVKLFLSRCPGATLDATKSGVLYAVSHGWSYSSEEWMQRKLWPELKKAHTFYIKQNKPD